MILLSWKGYGQWTAQVNSLCTFHVASTCTAECMYTECLSHDHPFINEVKLSLRLMQEHVILSSGLDLRSIIINLEERDCAAVDRDERQ